MDEGLLGQALHDAWWPALAAAFRVTGDLQFAEDAVQEACAGAVRQWHTAMPADPVAWLATTARRRAIDQVRREAVRPAKESAAARRAQEPSFAQDPAGVDPQEQLAMMFLCAHPAFDVATRTALTLRAVGGLGTHEIAAVLLLPEQTVAKRLVRARRKIRESGMRFAAPHVDALAARLDDVLATLTLLHTEGHRSSTGPGLLRPQLSDRAVAIARTLARLLPAEPEVLAQLALLLLTDARRDARVDDDGCVVLLAEQDRSRCDGVKIAEGNGCSSGRCGWAGPDGGSSRPRSPPAIPPRHQQPTQTGARSPRCTANCCATTRTRSTRPTGPSPSPRPRARPPG